MKDGLGRKIMIKFFGLRAKTYSYLIDDIKCVPNKKTMYKNFIKTFSIDLKLKGMILLKKLERLL